MVRTLATAHQQSLERGYLDGFAEAARQYRPHIERERALEKERDNAVENAWQIAKSERALREALEKISAHALARTGVPDRDKLVGIKQEADRSLAANPSEDG